MECPKCHCVFEEIEFAQVSVQRCTGCRGLWFDRSKHEYLKSIDGSEAIDIGNPELGKTLNEKGKFKCPECYAAMIRMADPDQHHLWYEACSGCFGVFFDAGEFRDYKERTVLDFVRDIFTPERP